jgi:hypothetical protein
MRENNAQIPRKSMYELSVPELAGGTQQDCALFLHWQIGLEAIG